MILFEPPVDIFHVDYGIVYKRSDGYGDTAKTHGVDGETEFAKNKKRHNYRKRERNKRYKRCANVHQEKKQHHNDEYSSLEQRCLKIGY